MHGVIWMQGVIRLSSSRNRRLSAERFGSISMSLSSPIGAAPRNARLQRQLPDDSLWRPKAAGHERPVRVQ